MLSPFKISAARRIAWSLGLLAPLWAAIFWAIRA